MDPTRKVIDETLTVESGFKYANKATEPTIEEDKVLLPFFEPQARSVNIIGQGWKHRKNQLLWVASDGSYVVLVRDSQVEQFEELIQYSVELPPSGVSIVKFKALDKKDYHSKDSLRCDVTYTGLPVVYNIRIVREKIMNEGALWFNPYQATTTMRQGTPYYFPTPDYLKGAWINKHGVDISNLDVLPVAERNTRLKKYIALQRRLAQDVLAERSLRVASFKDLGNQVPTNVGLPNTFDQDLSENQAPAENVPDQSEQIKDLENQLAEAKSKLAAANKEEKK